MMFWKVYFWFLSFVFLVSYSINFGYLKFWPYQIDLLVSVPSLVGFFLFAYRKHFLSLHFWQKYVPLYCMWDIYFNMKLLPAIEGRILGVAEVFGFLIIFPLWIALFLYAFKPETWQGDAPADQNEKS